MGKMYNLQCSKCQCGGIYEMGVGMLDFDPEIVIERWDKAMQGRVASAISEAGDWSFSRGIGICENCRDFVNVPVLRTTMADSSERILTGQCECGNDVLLCEDMEDIACPKCAGKVTVEVVGLFD